VKVRKKSGRQKAPWRNSTAEQNMKRQCRRAEHMWQKTKLVTATTTASISYGTRQR